MRIFYGFGIRFFYAVMWLVSWFHPKAKKWILGRRVSIDSYNIPKEKEVVWFHCASLGEFDQGLPVMNAYKEAHSDSFLLVTFFSPSGIEFYNKRDHQVDLAMYLPLDTKVKAEKFIAHFNPRMVFFVKYEFWYNHLKCARRNGAKIYGVSSLFRPSHRFFKWYGGFFRKALRLFDHFYAQDIRSKDLLNSIGINQVTVTGDTRYDRMIAVKDQIQENEIIRSFVEAKPVLILGSSWIIDEEILVPALSEMRKKYKLIIAPHDISEKHIEQISAEFDFDLERYTNFQNLGKDILILDTIGQLTNAYHYADLAYIGGGFTGKLHNILEPGAFGIPIFFGPKYARFPEAQLFLDHGVAYTIEDSFSFEKAVEDALGKRAQINEKLAEIFARNQGAAKKIISSLS
ncbi:3-deoxy-D-manno-octulosonic acid transferase [Fluviicola taffensis]|uniref:3-deoxy-D-manno-octulosonic acid transferase n=1 Tax=Fluviicola taffensis (strain DSM 16823 / NCIMB 13979 / RW262) TaxID=755732 RepID=F2IKC5_FLUTR|nr:glycosyltransferase N-terminal domain-containing protein [Fluviicola taffensis]AEA44028.1 Three-deoxy-D-manno-octulosonic-acid transferase domain-containing protein [Fluviicola taffensis DSM 16823]